MDITKFLEARITEDESLARVAAVGIHGEHKDAWDYGGYVLGAERDSTPKQDEFIVAWWPPRVLAECAAKRAILTAHPITTDVLEVSTHIKWGYACETCFSYGDVAEDHGYCDTLRAIAAIYKDHPDYQQEWAI